MNPRKAAAAILVSISVFYGCSTQADTKSVDGSEPIAAAEARDESGGRPPTRCNGVFDCAATVFTDFLYLPVRMGRSMSGDVSTATKEQNASAQ